MRPKPAKPFGFKPFFMITTLALCVTGYTTGCSGGVEKPQDQHSEDKSSKDKQNQEKQLAKHTNKAAAKNTTNKNKENTADTSLLKPEKGEIMSAGKATGSTINANAFSDASANIRITKQGEFRTGNSFFEKPWVAAPASTSVRDGLGALFNVLACQSCHIKDGRGHAPNHGETNFASLLLRTARSNITPEQRQAMLAGKLAKVPDSTVGGQIQDKSVPGVMHEADMKVTYEPKVVKFADGHKVTLRHPTWHIKNNYSKKKDGKFDADTIFSVRTAQPMIGLGMLEAIKASDIKSQADPNDTNNDGISGRYNVVHDVITNKPSLGRFGWKAGQPTVQQQSADAFSNDMGLTSRLFKESTCLPHQTACLKQPNGNGHGIGDERVEYDYEVRDDILDAVVFYAKNLAVPKRRNHAEQTVLRGKQRFMDMGCASCHTPKYVTAKQSIDIEQSEQTIRPYTDMLLHDMGDDLADFALVTHKDGTQTNTPKRTELVEFRAQANEWRTQPLWGIGLTKTVDKQATFLHDGRARTIMEAVLWHGGEAEKSKQQVLKLDQTGRDELMAFLNSL